MKLSLLFLAGLVSKVMGDITFYAHAVHSGSDVHLAPLKDLNGTLQVGGDGEEIFFLLPDDSTLANLDATTRIVLRNDTFVEVPRGIERGFHVDENNYLTFKNQTFVACPNGSAHSLALSCPDGIPIEIVATDISRVAIAKRNEYKAEKVYNTYKEEHDSQPFTLIAIAANTDFHYISINRVEENPHEFLVGSYNGANVNLILKSDGSLVDSEGKSIDVNSDGSIGGAAPLGRKKASNKFSIKNSKLVHDDSHFYACPSDSKKFVLSTEKCEGGTEISLETSHHF